MPEQPLDHPLYGARLDLEGAMAPTLPNFQAIAVTGKSQKLSVNTWSSWSSCHQAPPIWLAKMW